MYSIVTHLYVSCSGSITSVGEESANLSAMLTCNYMVSVRWGFLFLLVLGMGCLILLCHSLCLLYNYFGFLLRQFLFIAYLLPLNELDNEIRTAPTFPQFKPHIKPITNQAEKPITFGDIILTRTRHKYSSLRGDISRVNIIPNSNCGCGHPLKSAEHSFGKCQTLLCFEFLLNR